MAEAPPRQWPAIELRLEPGAPDAPATPDFDERLALALDGLGATAVEQPVDRLYRVYFPDATARQAAGVVLGRELGSLCTVAVVDVADEGWLQKVQSALGAVGVGRFVVAPPWDLPAGTPGDDAPTLIVIEPSMGFGTGHHESTRLCLRALETLHVAHRRVLDVGTGSGVLAIAAAKLAAVHVRAIDVDPDAVASARDNVSRNGVSGVVEVRQADLAAVVGVADVVLANLTVALLVRHAAALSGLVAPGGSLVTSGFTSDQAATVILAFPGLETADRSGENGWECVVFRHP